LTVKSPDIVTSPEIVPPDNATLRLLSDVLNTAFKVSFVVEELTPIALPEESVNTLFKTS
jgi:hypothetical protein